MKTVKVKVRMYDTTYAEVHDDGTIGVKSKLTDEKATNKNIDFLTMSIEDDGTVTARKVLYSNSVTKTFELKVDDICKYGTEVPMTDD